MQFIKTCNNARARYLGQGMHQEVACLDQQSVPGLLSQVFQIHLLLCFRRRSNLASQNKKKQATHQINKPFQNNPHQKFGQITERRALFYKATGIGFTQFKFLKQ